MVCCVTDSNGVLCDCQKWCVVSLSVMQCFAVRNGVLCHCHKCCFTHTVNNQIVFISVYYFFNNNKIGFQQCNTNSVDNNIGDKER